MKVTNVSEAKAHLSELLERVHSGEEIILGKSGKPVAKLVPFSLSDEPRRGGQWKGRVRIAEDFDAPLPPGLLAEFTRRSD